MPPPRPRALTPDQEREVCERYEFGEAMPRLSEIFDVGVGAIDGALRRANVQKRSAQEAALAVRSQVRLCRECGDGIKPNAVRPLCPDCAKLFCRNAECGQRLPHSSEVKTQYCSACKFAQRYKKKPPPLCRVCGRVASRGSRRKLCEVHTKCFCAVCDQPKPPQRVNKNCAPCENAKKRRLYAKRGRLCGTCGEREITVHASRCSHCLNEDYTFWRWSLLHMDRPCRQCGVTLARGRQVNYCSKCQRQRMKQRNRERAAIGAHRCATCKEPLAIKHDTYCSGCSTMLANWRKAWHAGDSMAKELGTVRSRHTWQEAEREAA